MHATKRHRGITALAAILLPLAAFLPSSPASAKAKQPPPTLGCTTVAKTGSTFDGTGSGTGRVLSWTAVTIPDTDGSCVTEVSTSNSNEYALTEPDGDVWSFGSGTNGELGNGSLATNFTTTARQVVFPPGVKIAWMPVDALPYDTAIAVDTDGNAWGWGLNKGGELCTGSQQQYDEPVQTQVSGIVTGPGLSPVAGADQHAVYDAGGEVETCGANTDGVGGYGTMGGPDQTSPKAVTSGLLVTAVTSSYDDAGMIDNGVYEDWGMNTGGQLGNGSAKNAGSPVTPVLPDPSPVVQAAQGGSDAANGQVMVLLADGSVYAWGNNGWDQTREAAGPNATTPIPLSPPAGASFTSIASGGGTNYGITPAGAVYAWGCGNAGQIGDGSTVTQPTPVQVMSGASVISSTANDVVVGAPVIAAIRKG